MSHTIIYNRADRLIETTVQGELTLNEIKEMVLELTSVAKENHCRLFLNDFREAKIKLSIFEIYDLPKIISGIISAEGLESYRLKRAMVAALHSEDLRFFETVTVNSGQNTKLFYSIDKAREWLLGK